MFTRLLRLRSASKAVGSSSRFVFAAPLYLSYRSLDESHRLYTGFTKAIAHPHPRIVHDSLLAALHLEAPALLRPLSLSSPSALRWFVHLQLRRDSVAYWSCEWAPIEARIPARCR